LNLPILQGSQFGNDEKKLHVSLGEVLIGRPSNLSEPNLLFFGGIFFNIL